MFELKKLLSYDNHPNIIIYNYDNISNIINILSNKKCNSNIYKGISYYSNNTYSIFDTKNINNKNILDFKSFINQIIKKNYNFTKKEYIIIKNLECNSKIQHFLFSMIEKSSYKFLFFSNNNCIYYKLQSICINIRYKKTINTKDILIQNKIIDNYLCNTIDIKNFKELSYILSCLNIPFCIILKILLEDIIDKFEITKDKKYKCIRFLCDIQYKYNNSYNKIFYYEYLFLNLYNILFNT
tara:strand:+ start:306 stop:1025 length:720 start_codon:yes stop_codon:yes gene_type:complete